MHHKVCALLYLLCLGFGQGKVNTTFENYLCTEVLFAGATHFKVQYRNTSASTYTTAENYAIAGQYTLYGLTSDTTYSIQVFSGTFEGLYESVGATVQAKTLGM